MAAMYRTASRDSGIRLFDEFCGGGGFTQGASLVPGIEPDSAANHNQHAINAHEANHPNVRHFTQDVTKMSPEEMPYAEAFAASPACPGWTTANGLKRQFDQGNHLDNFQLSLFLSDAPKDVAKVAAMSEKERERQKRAAVTRLLMHEPIRYLRSWIERGRPVLIGCVENVTECRAWSEWDAWIAEFHKMGYETRLIAYNSMHAVGERAPRAATSRNRLFLAYWHKSLGRTPNWRKWLSPRAWCASCETTVEAIQSWKKPGVDMGDYGVQYVYRCPNGSCLAEVFPETVPASAILNPALIGTRLGDRREPLAPKTMDRIVNGIERFWAPLLVPCGGTWRSNAQPLDRPLPTRTTRETDGVAFLPSFLTPMRGGGDVGRSRSLDEALTTITASGNHHGIVSPPPNLLLPYYGNSGSAVPASRPVGTLTTRDRYAVLTHDLTGGRINLDDVRFRMLDPEEAKIASAFDASYDLATNVKKIKTLLVGNAVTPNVAEIIFSALVECLTGEDLPRNAYDLVA